MNGKATVQLIGNLTRDVETKQVGDGAVASFAIAVNKKWKDKGGQAREQVSYFDCELWGNGGAVLAQYTGKGSPLYVTGELTQQRWEHEGQNRSKVVVRVADFVLLGGPKDDGEKQPGVIEAAMLAKAGMGGKSSGKPIGDDDIPF